MSAVSIRRYLDIVQQTGSDPAQLASLQAGLDTVFFEASNTRIFASEAARAVFREQWLGRYLTHDPQWAYVALGPSGEVAGYLVGCLDDPAVTARFSDISYFARLQDLTRRFPAHLHINLAPAFRGAGVGATLVNRFAVDAAAARAPGVHVVTSRGSRNVDFYRRNGFCEQGAEGEGDKERVFLGRALCGGQ
ncbi:MAG: GNAT family N-acetyltransferase [Hyphomicrobium sp.]